jgi:hypothetical protein
MRKKAEMKIREAAAGLGPAARYRLDRVRKCAGLYPKVYDKTILDMARLGTIRLEEGDAAELASAEIGNLVRRGETVFMYFSFAEANASEAAAEEAARMDEKIDILLAGVDAALWNRFEKECREREGKPALQKILEMIADYTPAVGNESRPNPSDAESLSFKK